LAKLAPNLEILLTQIDSNKDQWTALTDEYEEKMIAGNNCTPTIPEQAKLPGHHGPKKSKVIKF